MKHCRNFQFVAKKVSKRIFQIAALFFFLMTLILYVVPHSDASTLSVQMVQPPTAATLSTEGTTDWAHWGLTDSTSFNHKSGITQQISNYALIGSTAPGRFSDSRVDYSWTGGTPTTSVASTRTGIYFTGIGNGYRLTIPAKSTESVLKIYLGLWIARGRFEARLSDGSATPYVTYLDNATTTLDRVVTLTFSSPSSGVNLIVEYIIENNYGKGNITLQAATLVAEDQVPIPTVATPTITPSGGTYTDSVSVTLATQTSGASIRYTTNGTEPTSSSTLYTAPFTLTQSCTLRAKAFLSGYNDSATASASFIINPSGSSSTLSVQMVQPPTTATLSTEGTTDWAHWGLTDSTSFNHKSGITQQISNYALIGSTAPGRFSDSRVDYSWTGGTPTTSVASTRTGIYFTGIGNGYRLTIPAKSTESVLKIYLGLWIARGRFEARLSDGSATPYVTYLDNATTTLDRVVTLTFSSPSSGVNLIVEYIIENNYGKGNITLQAATLVAEDQVPIPTVATPTITPSGGTYTDSVSVTLATQTSGASIRYTTNGTEPTSSSTLYTAPFTLTQSCTLRAKAFLSGYNDSATASASFIINPSGSSSTLSVQMVQPPTTATLSTEGTTDWAHWGLTDSTSFNHKSGITQQISNYALIGSTAPGRFSDSRVDYSWTGGTPTTSVASTRTGIYFTGIGNGYRLTIPAKSTESVLKIYLGLWIARGRFEARLSDGSATPYVTYLDNATTTLDRVVTLTFSSPSSGVNLIVEYIIENNYGKGNITLQAATLSSTSTGLPFYDNFNRSVLGSDWSIYNDSPPKAPNWQIINGELNQTNRVESVSSFDGTYHKGTYVYLTSRSGLRDYRFSAEATYLNDAYGYADDIGIMFRYQNNDNYYRITLNSRYGFTRLEKKVNGTFRTLAKNARGFQKGAKLRFTVDVKGPTIQVFLDDDPLFGVTDESISQGSIALYCQDAAKFDNVLLEESSNQPSIVISKPTAYSVDTGSTLNVEAVTTNVPFGGYVQFLLDGISSIVITQPPYRAQYYNVSEGTHYVEAVLHGSSSELASDVNNEVHVLGDYYIAIGDSITNGEGDNYTSDNILEDGNIISFQGYEAPLTYNLNLSTSYPNIVFNEGIGGDKSYNAAHVRINSILERHPGANRALIMLGTNDSSGTLPVPSGLGCSGTSCSGTFKGNMQALVNTLISKQITPFVALIPPTFGSSQASRNLMIQQYNQVIRWELTGIQVGPDFYTFFTNSPDLFSDELHPNGLGYKAFWQLWYNVLLNQNVVPFVLDNLNPATYKQNLLEVGNNYYIDADYTLSSFPTELADGDVVWIMTADSDRNNTSGNSLSFDINANSTIYIGYDSRALSLPSWLANNFTPTGTVLRVTDPDVSTLNLYKADFTVGTVSLGGNKASGASFPNGIEAANYVVIVKKRIN